MVTESRKMKSLNLLIQTFVVMLYEQIDNYLDMWYNFLKAMRMKIAISRAMSNFKSTGKQYHVIPIKLKGMWMTSYSVVTRETVKHNKKIGVLRKNLQVEEILELAVFTTPKKLTYELIKNGVAKPKLR
jgi:hypothetical protein